MKPHQERGRNWEGTGRGRNWEGTGRGRKGKEGEEGRRGRKVLVKGRLLERKKTTKEVLMK